MPQLIRLGYSERQVRHRIGLQVLFRVYRGVYAVAGSKDTFEFRVMAGVLAGGEGALASHRCAAVLFGLRRIRCDLPTVTVRGRSAPELPGLESHRREILEPADRTRIGVIPVTSPAWTLLDLAGVFDLAVDAERARLGGALDDVIVRKLASLRAVERLLDRVGRRRLQGAAVLGELVAERAAGTRPSQTGLEDELLEVFRMFGLPEPERQYEVRLPNGGKAIFDAAYPELKLAFEADGDESHKGLLDRMRDQARDGQCRLIGWDVHRYSTDDIRLRPTGIAEEVDRLRREALAA
jgi:very-short-patch-repair endonuclease